jgi:hypothetical protein
LDNKNKINNICKNFKFKKMKTTLIWVLTQIGRTLIKLALVKTSALLKDLEYKGKGEYTYNGKTYTENETTRKTK